MAGMGRMSGRRLWAVAGVAVLVLVAVGWSLAPATVLVVGVVAAALAVPVGVVLVVTALLSRR